MFLERSNLTVFLCNETSESLHDYPASAGCWKKLMVSGESEAMDEIYKLLGMRHPNDWPDWIFWLPFIGFMLMMPTVLFLARKKSSIQYQLNHWRFFIGIFAICLTAGCAISFEVEEVSPWFLISLSILLLPATRFIYFRLIIKAKKGVSWLPKW